MNPQQVSRFSDSSLIQSDVAGIKRVTLASDVVADGFVARTFYLGHHLSSTSCDTMG